LIAIHGNFSTLQNEFAEFNGVAAMVKLAKLALGGC
jgi:hypothetical protein